MIAFVGRSNLYRTTSLRESKLAVVIEHMDWLKWLSSLIAARPRLVFSGERRIEAELICRCIRWSLHCYALEALFVEMAASWDVS